MDVGGFFSAKSEINHAKVQLRYLQTCQENLLDVLLCQGCVGILQTFVDSDVVRHLVDTAFIDVNLKKMHGDVDALEELVRRVNGLF